jgi:hypothetical protein
MKDEDRAFLNKIATYVKERPDLAPYVTEFASKGLQEHIKELREQCSDIEAALSVTLMHRKKVPDEFVKERLGKWKDKAFFRWDWYLERE